MTGSAAQLRCGGRTLELEAAVVMGVLNVTPDSFSDGGLYRAPGAALARAEQMVEEGATIVDVGGESTRPGASRVDSLEEIRRVLPVIERIAARLPLLISVDTSNPELMRRAASAGAHMINDVRALRVPGALEAAAAGKLGVCLMHMRGEPPDMQRDPVYGDVVAEIRGFLQERVRACVEAGIERERLCLDPGFGFGKTTAHNLELLQHLPEFTSLDRPLCVGLSRKSLVAALTGRPAAERMAGSVALATVAVLKGARIVRAHDVAATVDAVRIANVMHAASTVPAPVATMPRM
jgi:dihydropteroate synthase